MRVVERVAAAALLPAHDVDGAPVHEREDPRARLRALDEEPVGGAPDGEERLLDGVLGERLVAEDAQREAVGLAGVAVVDLGERAIVGPGDKLEQSLVRQVGASGLHRSPRQAWQSYHAA